MNFERDLSIFLSPKIFGINAVLKIEGQDAKPLVGIFDNEHYEVSNESYASVSTSSPRFTCNSEEVRGSRGGSLTLDDDVYIIVDVQPDGTGITVLILEKQP